MPKIDPAKASEGTGSRYPAPFDEPCRARSWRRLGDVAGLTQFGVNLVRLPPGAWSSQRHWHSHEDEFVHVLAGEVVQLTGARRGTFFGGEVALDLMFWPWGRRIGLWLEPEYDAVAQGGVASGVGATGGLLVGW